MKSELKFDSGFDLPLAFFFWSLLPISVSDGGFGPSAHRVSIWHILVSFC